MPAPTSSTARAAATPCSASAAPTHSPSPPRSARGNVDTITDFAAGVDKIVAGGGRASRSPALAAGAPARRPARFVARAAAARRCQRLYHLQQRHRAPCSTTPTAMAPAPPSSSRRFSTGLSLTAADFIVSGPANNAPTVTSGATREHRREQPGQHDRLSGRRQRRRRRPDHLVAERRRRRPAHDRRRQRRGAADHVRPISRPRPAIRSTSSPAISARADAEGGHADRHRRRRQSARRSSTRRPRPTTPSRSAQAIDRATLDGRDQPQSVQ